MLIHDHLVKTLSSINLVTMTPFVKQLMTGWYSLLGTTVTGHFHKTCLYLHSAVPPVQCYKCMLQINLNWICFMVIYEFMNLLIAHTMVPYSVLAQTIGVNWLMHPDVVIVSHSSVEPWSVECWGNWDLGSKDIICWVNHYSRYCTVLTMVLHTVEQ